MPTSTPRPRSASRALAAGWQLRTTSGPARALHDRAIPDDPVPEIWVHHIEGPALVLGSTQSDDLLDVERARADGIEICRRRSGGGIVSLLPGNCCWIDVILPASSPLWTDDVGHAFAWVGATWARALDHAVPSLDRSREVIVHRGSLQGGAAGRLVCFASLGPGEVTVGGRKVIGLSQRRNSRAARFQTAVQGPWDADLLRSYVDPERVEAVGLDWDRLDIGLPSERWPGPDRLAEAFAAALPPPG